MKGLISILSALLLVTSFNLSAGEREAVAWEYIDQGAVVIDVRTTEEYALGHLQDALHIPYKNIVNQLTKLQVPKNRQIMLYCRSGHRASIAEKALRQAGYNNLHNGGGLQPLIQEFKASQAQ